MFDKNELCILLCALENFKGTTMLHCICCSLVDYREDYAKAKYCVEYCSVGKELGNIDSLISKIKGKMQ